ncbi:esterase-like activity of phytase-domain-containing protein [Bombardia bombarda]|uniref:Esterase-like activity of phytase-domain-containing protein n=1 Tax=Bombardia bombarda TaxID=252184 RepID=A0AA39XC22_9PEZI|nr:esterase-like activity of phytase-domain-containing protein [Bombardia bombarda]
MVAVWLRTALAALSFASTALGARCYPASPPVTCSAKTYTYTSLHGYGSVPSDDRDQYGDTISLGSSIAVAKWKKVGDTYRGTLYGLPDRGWNTNGTQNTIPRVHIFDITFTPVKRATVANPSAPNIAFKYKKSILLSGPDGTPMTGLDPDFIGGLSYSGFPLMPAATYPGDGFGGQGPGGKRIALDAEGIVLDDDGGFWISDEYGPSLYKFSSSGKMISAIQAPDALLPIRNGQISFNSNTPPIYNPSLVPVPADPDHGRQNNQGYEGLTASPDGKTLWVMLQSAARQDGGASSSRRENTRLLKYDISKKNAIQYAAEYVVPLPIFKNANGNNRIAAQSEMLYISDTQFLILARDSGSGRGQSDSLSRYRHVDIVDISGATNIKGPVFDDIQNGNITIGGTANPSDTLVAGIVPAKLCPFLDFNLNEQLSRFKSSVNGSAIHNGAPDDLGLLNEKWESLALLPVNNVKDGRDEKDEYFLLTVSDNDFVTDNGFIDFGKIQFKDTTLAVPFLENQALLFKVTLPAGSKPLI